MSDPIALQLTGDAAFWAQLVTHTRMLGIALVVGVIGWILITAPPGRYRTIRLLLAFAVLATSLAGMLISVFVFGLPPI